MEIKLKKVLLSLLVLCFLSQPALADMIATKIKASNGVEIDLNSDEFAERYEYSAPVINLTSNDGVDGYLLIFKVRRAGTLGGVKMQGSIMYRGEWRWYETAVFKGGDAVDFKRTDSEVGSCRYGCSLTEDYSITLTPEQIAKHAENGNIPIQIRARSTQTLMVTIPVAYINALNEVAK